MLVLKRLDRIAATLLCAAIGGLTANAALAQSGSPLEEIVVTATKRAQTLQEIPVAVSVTDADTIDKAQILDVLDLQTVVPSLRVTQLQTSANTNFLIRGFGNGANNPGIEPSVGVFIDGVYRSRSASALSDLPNLERIEVLRGPQSTLFGKNASAGVISIVTAAPSQEFGGSAKLTAGNYGQVGVKADVTGPLSDKLAVSLSGGYNQRDGYYENLSGGSDFNERERWGVRGQALYEPRDDLSVRVIADYDQTEENCCGVANLVNGPTGPAIFGVGGALVPDDPFAYASFSNRDSVNEVENAGISVQADFAFDAFELVSITSFRNQNTFEDPDSDFTSADILGRNRSSTDISTFTQELRFSGQIGDRTDWMLGGFFFDEKVDFLDEALYGDDYRNYIDILTGGGIAGLEAAIGVPVGTFLGSGVGVVETTGLDNKAVSVFSTLDFHLNDRTTLTLGVNFTNDKKDAFVNQINDDAFSALDMVEIGFGGLFAALTGGQAPTPDNFALFPDQFAQASALSTVPCDGTNDPLCNSALALQPVQFFLPFVGFPNVVENGESDDSETTWTVRLAFDVTDDINIYGNVGTGFKASSWNLSRDSRPFPADLSAIQNAGLAPPNLSTGTRFASPEEATVIELGLKARFDRGAINIAVFDQEIDGFQSNIFTGTGFALANAGTQSSVGVEFDATYYPSDPLQLTIAATWLDPEYDSFPGGNGPDGPTDLTGTAPAGVHDLSATATATYTRDFANGMTGFVRGEYQFESDVQVVENVLESIASREVSLLNASFGISTESGWDFTVWGRNLTEDEFLYSAFPSVAQAGSFSGYPNVPRTYGLSVRKNFQ